jgi:hypothetical protein
MAQDPTLRSRWSAGRPRCHINAPVGRLSKIYNYKIIPVPDLLDDLLLFLICLAVEINLI